MWAISSIARANTASFAFDGFVDPLTFRTNCSAAARISLSVAGGSKLWRVLMFRHMWRTLADRVVRSAPVSEHVETVVIGAGQAGLATSACLRRRGLPHVVLERGSVANTWRTQRWDGFFLNTPSWAHSLPDYPYTGPEPDGFMSLAETIDFLERYAAAIDAPVRQEVEVTGVRRADGALTVQTTRGDLTADNVVVASGAYQRPLASPHAGRLPADVLQLHTSDYRRPDDLPAGAVLVVGSGQSGCQIADELTDAGRTVYLSVGRCPWLPRRYRGREIVHWLLETGIADDTVDALPSPAARLACNPPISGNDGGHDCNPRWLARRGVRLLGRLEGVDDGRVTLAPGLRETLAAGDAFVAEIARVIDEHVASAGRDVGPPEPEEPSPEPDEVAELDLRDAGISTVMWANGFRPDHSWIEGLDIDEQGWPVTDRGVTAIPGLYFVGVHWLHKRKSALLLGVGEDAEHVVQCLAAR